MTPDLFSDVEQPPRTLGIGREAFVLRGFALDFADRLLAPLNQVMTLAPLRHLVTPSGLSLSASTTCCGALGWVSDRLGYRYSAFDPLSGQPWPPMPEVFLDLAGQAAAVAGFAAFVPDACLINCYRPGAGMGLHQDRDERHFAAPIVSVSLGLPATFLFGGHQRSDKPARISLLHGDVVVWGGEDRLRFHGILPLPVGEHSDWGERRINLTFRVAG